MSERLAELQNTWLKDLLSRFPLFSVFQNIHQNTGKENRYGKNFFAVLISTLGRFDRANKKKSVIYTLTVGFQSNYQQIKANFQLEAVNS